MIFGLKYCLLDAQKIQDIDMVEDAMESADGSVISIQCLETCESKMALLSIFRIPPLYTANSPRTCQVSLLYCFILIKSSQCNSNFVVVCPVCLLDRFMFPKIATPSCFFHYWILLQEMLECKKFVLKYSSFILC